MEYRYGMRLRGFSIGCQPMKGLLRREDDTTGKYWDILVYDRELTKDEIHDYELNDLQEVKTMSKAYEIYENAKKSCTTEREMFNDILSEIEEITGYTADYVYNAWDYYWWDPAHNDLSDTENMIAYIDTILTNPGYFETEYDLFREVA